MYKEDKAYKGKPGKEWQDDKEFFFLHYKFFTFFHT